MAVSYEGCFKFVFIPTAVVVILFGLALSGLGIARVVKYKDEIGDAIKDGDDDLKEELYVHAFAVVAACGGLLVLLVVALGCCAGFKENKICISVYIPLFLCLVLLVMVCAVVIFAAKSDDVKKKLKEKMEIYNPDEDDDEKIEGATKTWDKIQEALRCCGVDSYKDWEEADNDYLDDENWKVPESCCQHGSMKDDVGECVDNPEDFEDELEGCAEKLTFGKEVGIVAIVMAVIMAINLVGACFMCVKMD